MSTQIRGEERKKLVQRRRRALEAMTREEWEAQFVLISLMPEGKPADGAEQVALILAQLKDNPGHACSLAMEWLEVDSSYEWIVELVDACWQSHPNELRLLLGIWDRPGPNSLITVWAEHLLLLRTDWAVQHLVLLLEWHFSEPRVHGELMMSVLKGLENWEEDSRQQILVAMRPLWERAFTDSFKGYKYGVEGYEYDVEAVVQQLWEYDNSPTNRAWLDTLLAAHQKTLKDIEESRHLRVLIA